jgi:hypothetical protein
VLIYVGLTDRGLTRQVEHLATKAWAREVAETHWEHYATRREAAARERALIRTKHPRYNVVYRQAGAKPDQGEFRLRTEQHDVLGLARAELASLRKEYTLFTEQFGYRFQALENIILASSAAVKYGRPMTEQEMGPARKYLTYLALDRRERAARDKTRAKALREKSAR